MKTHTIIAKDENGTIVEQHDVTSKKEAANRAAEMSKRHNNKANVFVFGSNGQCTVYLNPNGNYEPTGEAW